MEQKLVLGSCQDLAIDNSFESLWVDTMVARAAREAQNGEVAEAVYILYTAQYCYPFNGLIKQALGHYISALRRFEKIKDNEIQSTPRTSRKTSSIFRVLKHRFALNIALSVIVLVFLIHYAENAAGDFVYQKNNTAYVAELTKTTDAGHAEMTYKNAIDASSSAPLILMKPKQASAGAEYQVVYGPFLEARGASAACELGQRDSWWVYGSGIRSEVSRSYSELGRRRAAFPLRGDTGP